MIVRRNLHTDRGIFLRKRGKARLFFNKFRGHLAIGGVSLLLVGGTAGCSGCSKPSKKYMQKIDEQKKVNFDLMEVVLRTGGKDTGVMATHVEKGAGQCSSEG